MKKILLFVLVAVTISCGSSKKTVIKPSPELADFQNTITEEGLFVDLAILSSDSLEGRNTGSEGERKAAEYLANRYQNLGLIPVGDDNTYFQNFELYQTTFDSIEFELTVGNELVDQSIHSATKIGSFTRFEGGENLLEGKIEFIGFGQVTSQNYEGKWLLSFYDPTVSSLKNLKGIIEESNALGAILISTLDLEEFESSAYILQGEFGITSDLELSYLKPEKGAITSIHPNLAASLLGKDSIDELAQFESELRSGIDRFESYSLDASFSYKPFLEINYVETRNVVAFIEGTDPELKNEVIILSAHYDHVGIGTPDSEGDALYNGADDDGSGTVGLLHAAQAFTTAKSAGADLKRSVLILHVSAEEIGLFGSRYYSDYPIFPIENTVANLNADMIGRIDEANAGNPDYIYIIGGKIISSGLQETLERANEMSVNLELSDRFNDLNDTFQFYRRSDHWNFGRLGVPFIFYFNGTHADYHRPSDEIEKIDFEALKKRTQLIFMTASLLSNADDRPIVDNTEFIDLSNQ
jgi:hypothetical protein